jgi:hypothetical protein
MLKEFKFFLMKIKTKIISKFHIKVICIKFRYLDKKNLNSNKGSYGIKLSIQTL